MNSSEYPEYVAQNVEVWTKANAEHTGPRAREAWAKDEIDSETRSSLQAIRDQLADLTVATAEKVVRRQLDETEQRRLIDEAMADVDFSQFAPAESGTPAEGGE